jgi:NTE family protein/lysophospholipid hydrolase
MPDWQATTGPSQLTKRRLVLLQEPDTTLPAGTAAWLDEISASTHHHVRLGHPGDMARLARLLAGQGVGLVLSGGGARGYAQIGVVRGLQEAGIPLDWVCGVSAGAIIAGQFAMGLDEPAIMARMRAVQRGIDYTLPIHSITTGRNWNDSMRDLFGDARIEDFWLGYFCVSANLTEAREEIHDRGPAMIAARSSASFPGLVPPVYYDGNILVDGGLFNNLPVDLMKQKPEIGSVIAVDVGVGRGIREIRPFEPYASGWTALRQRLLRQRPAAPVPSILEVLGSAFTITNVRTAMATAGLADLLLQPPVGQYGLTDFGKFEVLSEAGYRYTKEQLDRWTADGTLDRLGLSAFAASG